VISVMIRFRRAGERQHTWDPKLADATHWTCTRCGVMRMRNPHNDIKRAVHLVHHRDSLARGAGV